jgi:hypothetical protein
MISRLFRIPYGVESVEKSVGNVWKKYSIQGKSIPYRGEKCGEFPQNVWKNVVGNPSVYDLVDVV